MSTTFMWTPPTEDDIQAKMLADGSDYDNAKRTLELDAGLAAIDTMSDMADAKKVLKAIVRRIGAM